MSTPTSEHAHAPRRNRGKSATMSSADKIGNGNTVPGTDELAEGIELHADADESFAEREARKAAELHERFTSPRYGNHTSPVIDAPVVNKRTRAKLKR